MRRVTGQRAAPRVSPSHGARSGGEGGEYRREYIALIFAATVGVDTLMTVLFVLDRFHNSRDSIVASIIYTNTQLALAAFFVYAPIKHGGAG